MSLTIHNQGLKICKPCMSKHGDSHVIIDKEDNLLGIGFSNEEQTFLHPKLVLNAQ